ATTAGTTPPPSSPRLSPLIFSRMRLRCRGGWSCDDVDGAGFIWFLHRGLHADREAPSKWPTSLPAGPRSATQLHANETPDLDVLADLADELRAALLDRAFGTLIARIEEEHLHEALLGEELLHASLDGLVDDVLRLALHPLQRLRDPHLALL